MFVHDSLASMSPVKAEARQVSLLAVKARVWELDEQWPKHAPVNDYLVVLWCLCWMTRRFQRMWMGCQGGEGVLLLEMVGARVRPSCLCRKGLLNTTLWLVVDFVWISIVWRYPCSSPE